mmetsp:Transcript_12709/g.29298  ORF Transcript_12709/g.29298 Transcript_12709/m.29298 type:complete len:224 (-) Transcript_12709:207-878(-)
MVELQDQLLQPPLGRLKEALHPPEHRQDMTEQTDDRGGVGSDSVRVEEHPQKDPDGDEYAEEDGSHVREGPHHLHDLLLVHANPVALASPLVVVLPVKGSHMLKLVRSLREHLLVALEDVLVRDAPVSPAEVVHDHRDEVEEEDDDDAREEDRVLGNGGVGFSPEDGGPLVLDDHVKHAGEEEVHHQTRCEDEDQMCRYRLDLTQPCVQRLKEYLASYLPVGR